nr:orf88EGC126 [uncultured bacterium]
MQITKRPWNLGKAQRLFILLCAGLYLLAFHPWSSTPVSGAASVYAGAAAMLVLALLPSKVRLLSALALDIATALVVVIALQAIGAHD